MNTIAKVTIRPFSPKDQTAAKTLINTGLGEHFGFVDPSFNPDLDNIMESYVRRGHAFVVAEVGGALAGTGALQEENETAVTGRIVRMSVSKTHRRQKIGQQILDRLLQIADQRGYQRILVETNRDWYDAIGFYRANGFVQYDKDTVSVYLSLIMNNELGITNNE